MNVAIDLLIQKLQELRLRRRTHGRWRIKAIRELERADKNDQEARLSVIRG